MLDTYGQKPLAWTWACGIIQKKAGWIKIEEHIALKHYDKALEEE